MGMMQKLRRLIAIGRAFLRRNLFFTLYRDVYHRHISDRDCSCEADQQLKQRAKKLREAFEELGPTFIKLGQVLSRRPDLLPQGYILELEALQDHAAPLPFADIQQAMRQRCVCGERMLRGAHHPLCFHCNPFEAVFERFDEAPLASASLAQVHRARFRGEEVVVKLLRPGVLDVINLDLSILWRVKGLLIRVLDLDRNIDADSFFVEFRRRLEQEVDLKAEALNIERFRGLQHSEPQVRAPKVYWGFERSDLLVMEYLQGEPIRTARALPTEQRKVLASLILRNFLKQIFVDNFFHADPHPGNILLLRDGVIGYLDFGTMGRVDRASRRGMQQLFDAMIAGDADEAARAVLKLGGTNPFAVDQEALQLDLERLIQLYRVQDGGRWTDQIIETARRYSIRLPKSVIPLTKGLVLVESLALELDPEVNLMQEIEAIVGEVALEGIKDKLSVEIPEILESYSTLLAELPTFLQRWLAEREGRASQANKRGWFSRRARCDALREAERHPMRA
jgi:ubiquinone biosynthesis protein